MIVVAVDVSARRTQPATGRASCRAWFIGAFEHITNFGLSGWFLFPFGLSWCWLAAAISPALPRLTQGVLAMLAARFGFLFLAIGVPGLFVTIVKRLIGRARPYVGEPRRSVRLYAVHLASRIRQHAVRPCHHGRRGGGRHRRDLAARARGVMWLYALVIMFSRVVVLAHHPSDVIAGALVGVVGAVLVRRWFAARRLVFCRSRSAGLSGAFVRGGSRPLFVEVADGNARRR